MLIDSDYLDLAIALAVVFFLTSLVVSGLNEVLQLVTRVRAKFLWAFLHQLTLEADKNPFKRLPQGFWETVTFWRTSETSKMSRDPRPALGSALPAFDGGQLRLAAVAERLGSVSAPQIRGEKRTTIKHIPSHSLAGAFIEVFTTADQAEVIDGVKALAAAVGAARTEAAAKLGFSLTRLVDQPSSAEFGPDLALLVAADASDGALVAAAGRVVASLGGGSPDQVRQAFAAFGRAAPGSEDKATQTLVGFLETSYPTLTARAGIDHAVTLLAKTPIGPTVRRLWSGAQHDIDQFRAGLESWFDAEFSRLGGFYKRTVRWILAILAAMVALTLNVDALALGTDLWHNPEGRSALIAEAEAIANGSSDRPGDATALAALNEQCDIKAKQENKPITDPKSAANVLRDSRDCVRTSIDELNSLDVIDSSLVNGWSAWKATWTDRHVLGHLAGVAVFWAALLVGAPFWFDLIKRLTGLRKGLVGNT